MNGVIELIKDGEPTGEFSAYAKIGRDNIKMLIKDNNIVTFNNRKEALLSAKEFESKLKNEYKKNEW